MKKHLTVALGLALMTGSAFASKARLIALGENAEGSYYINDVRNVFLNPAEINNHKDTVTMEWGASGTAADSDTAPQAEAGIIHDGGNFVYGLVIGNENADAGALRNASSLTNYYGGTQNSNIDNAKDFFIGGEAGMKWGASLTYSASEDETQTTTEEQSLQILKLGVMKNKWGAYLHFVAANEAEQVTVGKFETDQDISLGFTYDLSHYRLFGEIRMDEYSVAGGTATEDQRIKLGAARVKNLNDKVRLYTKLEVNKTTSETGANETETMNIPLTIAVEADVKDWLALRGSIAQNIIGYSENNAGKKTDTANTTDVNAGATFKFGDLSVDGLIGTTGTTGNTTSSTAEQGVLSTDNLLTRVSLTYKY